MGNLPFELRGRRVVDEGVNLIFRCVECGAEGELFIRDQDTLEGNIPFSCPCGVEVNMYFGSPMVGRALLKSLKHVPDPAENYRRCQNPSMN